MKNIIIGTVLSTVLILGISITLFSGESKQSTSQVSYSTTAKEKPAAQVSERNFDFGKIKVKDTVEKEFKIKNIGTKPLQLYNIKTSCDCTAAQIIYKGKESQEFSMHASLNNEVIEITPNTEAVVKVIYRPFKMPVYGEVSRETYVSTNDPKNSKLVFSVKAFVE